MSELTFKITVNTTHAQIAMRKSTLPPQKYDPMPALELALLNIIQAYLRVPPK